MAYTGYDEKTKARNKKYMDKLARVTLWLYPEEKKNVEANAHRAGKSINQYIKDALAEYEDDLFCEKLYQDYLNDPDRGEFVSFDEALASAGLTYADMED